MCSSHLGHIDVTEHRIDRVPDAKPARQEANHTNPTERLYIRGKVYRLIKADVQMPLNVNWLRLFFLFRNEMSLYAFALIVETSTMCPSEIRTLSPE